MKIDNKNALKLQISTYLEESLSMVGRMMLEDVFNDIDVMNDEDATMMVNAHYDDNIFDLIVPYLKHASEEYGKYKATPEGIQAVEELKAVMEQVKQAAIEFNEAVKVIKNGNDNEGNGNVH